MALQNVEVIYLDLPGLGRGEVVRMFLEDNGIPYKDRRVAYDENFQAFKQAIIKDGTNPAGTLPVVKIDGRVYTQHISICRYIARALGLYGKDAEVDFFADSIADAYSDWRNLWVQDMFGDPAVKEEHFSKRRYDVWLKVFEAYQSRYPDGPYFTGSIFTFADIAVFQMIHDSEAMGNTKILDGYPLLTKFYAAVADRPAIKAYIYSPRRKGQQASL